MHYPIDRRKVAGVIVEVNQALVTHGFNRGEIMVGLSELLGRIVVDTATNAIGAHDMRTVIVDHLDRTILIGQNATGKHLITKV